MALISSKYEAVDKIVRSFAIKINEYVTAMREEADSIRTNIRTLGMRWEGDLYTGFKSKMDTELAKLEVSLARGEKLEEELKKLSAQLTDAIEKLRKAGK